MVIDMLWASFLVVCAVAIWLGGYVQGWQAGHVQGLRDGDDLDSPYKVDPWP